MLKETFTSISKKMTIDFEELTSKINHNGEKGTARENVLQTYLRDYIPDRFSFSKSTIIDSEDSQSKQVDIIIHDKYTTPVLMDMDSTKVIPIESVYAVIEVKSVLTKEELRKSIENINSVKKLHKKTTAGISFPTAGFIFAYDSDSSFDTVYKNFVDLSSNINSDNRVTCLCVLNKGNVVSVDKNNINCVSLFPNINTIYAMINSLEDSLLIFYLFLMQVITQIQVFPPDMVAYAQSSDMLNTQFTIPKDYLPDDASLQIFNKKTTMAELNEISKNGKKMLGGGLNKNENLDCFFNIYVPMFKISFGSFDKIPHNTTLNYFGQTIIVKKIIEMYIIYSNKENADEQQIEALKEFEDFLFRYYDENRADMINNSATTHF